ncbi:MAG: hypothetical protein WAK10_09380 [Methanoregula sp.]
MSRDNDYFSDKLWRERIKIPLEGMIVEVPCSGKAYVWFFDNHCAILSIAKELITNQKKKAPKGIAVY